MDTENSGRGQPEQPTGRTGGPTRPPRGLAFRAAVVLLAVVSVSAATGFLRWLKSPEAPPPGSDAAAPAPLFRGWPEHKPDLVLVLSGQEHGYLQPCGCSEPQYGGLERRFNFLQDLRQRGWPVVALDLGDLPDKAGPQTVLKYGVSMRAHQAMGYTAVGTGRRELEMPLLTALAEHSLNNPTPRVLAANLLKREELFPGMVASWEVAADKDGKAPRVGVVGLVGPSVADKIRDPDIAFAKDNRAVIAAALKELQPQRPELYVLLYQGSPKEAEACAKQFPQFRVILCLTPEDEPSGVPNRVGETFVIGVGHKGRHVGAVGVFRTGKPEQPFELRYQLVSLGPDFKTPPGREADNPVLDLLEKYTAEVKRGGYLNRYPQHEHPIQVQAGYEKASYVGSQKCKSCHADAYEVWAKSGHAHAFDSLVKATRPGNRQFDGECVACHVVGFGYQTGYRTEEGTPLLKNVGCESCHGPGSLHVQNPQDLKLRALMNPHKEQEGETAEAKERRLFRSEQSCMKCHDADNDVHWSFDKWKKIAHPTPKE